MVDAVLLVCGLVAAVLGTWRGYVVAREAVGPFVHEGDPTRTLIEAAAPSTRGHGSGCSCAACSSRVPGWRSRCTGSTCARRRARDRPGEAGRPAVRHPRALGAGHRHRGPLPAADGLEDVLRLLDGLRRRRRRTRHTCPVCLGLPGHPAGHQPARRSSTSSRRASRSARRFPRRTRWDRKNYFYPDLPKGYQISQYDLPLAADGSLTVDTSDGPVRRSASRRAHLEEDTAKLIHARDRRPRASSLVDFNRSGAPLMEIVTEPVRPHGRAGAPLRRGAAAAPARDRRERCRHGARPDAGRGQRLAAAARRRTRSGRGSRSRT